MSRLPDRSLLNTLRVGRQVLFSSLLVAFSSFWAYAVIWFERFSLTSLGVASAPNYQWTSFFVLVLNVIFDAGVLGTAVIHSVFEVIETARGHRI